MKELSIEEKAKRYDKAIERAKDMLSYKEVRKEDMEYLFPELKESEDERILKIIKETLKSYNRGIICGSLNAIDYADCLAWLEAQGKNNMGISEATKKKLEDSLNEALEKETSESCNEFLDKQGEQKPADKVVPSVFKDKLLELFQIFRWRCKDHILTNGEILEYVDAHIQELINTIQNPAWSEEDEARYESCIKVLQTSDGYDTINAKWLKFLKEKNTWKPSDE